MITLSKHLKLTHSIATTFDDGPQDRFILSTMDYTGEKETTIGMYTTIDYALDSISFILYTLQGIGGDIPELDIFILDKPYSYEDIQHYYQETLDAILKDWNSRA